MAKELSSLGQILLETFQEFFVRKNYKYAHLDSANRDTWFTAKPGIRFDTLYERRNIFLKIDRETGGIFYPTGSNGVAKHMRYVVKTRQDCEDIACMADVIGDGSYASSKFLMLK